MTITEHRPQVSGLSPRDTKTDVTTGPSVELRDSSRFTRSLRDRVFSEGAAVYIAAFAVYLAVAILLDFKYESFSGDAVARMANGFYIVYSRDPHLAAVGFVWTPLQSVADLFFLLFNNVWSALSHHDMAGSLVSALSMAGAAHQIRSALREWGNSRTARLLLTATFALNPMILFYSGNGMSEGLYLFTLVASTRYLLRWIRQGDLRSLTFSATALGLCYLTRNEASGAAALGFLGVVGVSFARQEGRPRARLATALGDGTLFALPAFISAIGWAVVSDVIVGQPFPQFTSIYGNSAQEASLHHKVFSGRVTYEVHAIGSLAPLIPLLIMAALLLALYRRDARIVAPLTVLGGALGFDVLAYLNNSIEDFFRYFIATIPLEVLLVGSLLAAAPSRASRPPSSPGHVTRGFKVLESIGALILVLIVMVPATITTAGAMFNPNIGSEETAALGFIFHKHLTKEDVEFKERYSTVIQIGNYLTGLRLPNGDIIFDNATGCVPDIITTVSQPKLFVIPNDRDFQKILADPLTFHVHYIMEPNPAQTPVTAENISYPGLWRTGGGFAKQLHQIPSRGGCPEFRLFQVVAHPSQANE